MGATLLCIWVELSIMQRLLCIFFNRTAVFIQFIAMGRTCAKQHMMEVVSAGRRELVHGRTAETNYINNSKHES